MEVRNIVEEAVIKNIPKKKKRKKAKWLSEEALQIAEKRREVKGKEKEKNESESHSVGTLQARILEWVALPFSRGSSQPRGQTQVSRIAGRFFTNWAIWMQSFKE